MRKQLCHAILSIALVSSAAPALAQGTAFTYQGQLKNSGTPVNGSVDLVFKLFDALAAGTQQGSTLTQNGVGVTNGLFTVSLDFGVSPYTANAARWLEITVNGQPLSPRQPLTPTPFALNTRGIHVDAGGKVGIGTSAPVEPLSVRTAPSDYGFSHTDGTVTLSSFVGGSTGGGWLGTRSNHSLSFFTGDSPARMTIGATGQVGIGTVSPSDPLTIQTGSGQFFAGYGWVHTDGVREVGSYVDVSGGWLGTRSNHPLKFFTNNSVALMTLTTDGRFGIGTTPAMRLDVNGRTRVRRGSDVSAGIWFYEATDRAFVGMLDNNIVGFYGAGGIGWGLVMNVNNGRVAVGHANPQTALHVNGTTRTNVVEITGADLAEKFAVSEPCDPGTVMTIDATRAGQLCVARKAYDRRVAGVVSGANAFPAGAILGHLPGNEDAPAIALSGRVWVKCDATGAAIEPGDLLTTSDHPGHAMKAVDRERSHGAVIGKAMTSLGRGERGLVLVLVNLQ